MLSGFCAAPIQGVHSGEGLALEPPVRDKSIGFSDGAHAATMRIVHTLLSTGFAGSERSTAEACNAQARSGHRVLLLVRRSHRGPSGHSVLDHIDPAVEVQRLPDRLLTGHAMRRAIQAFGADVIHTHLRRSTRIVAAMRTDAVTVATLHLHLNSPAYLRLDALFCNARWQVASIPASYAGRVYKMHNSLVPAPRLDPLAREALRRQLGVGPGTFLIGGVGRLVHSKGWDILLRAFSAAGLDDARLLLIGDGRERAWLERIAPANAAILGHRHDIKPLYAAFDLFVCPSRREPLPRTMLEAYDAGTPVLAADTGGCRELVEDYGGWLFPVDDVRALAGQLRRLAAERPARRYPDLTAHHIDAVNAAYLSAYAELLELRERKAARDAAWPPQRTH